MASFPGSVFNPATRSAGQTIDGSHINDLQDEVVAIEAGFRNATAPLNSSNSTVVNLSVTGGSTLATLSVGATSTFAGAVTVSTGVLTLGQGQIAFPATAVASGGANTLDHYGENPWTPANGSTAAITITNTSQAIRVKIGQLVYVAGDVTFPVTVDGAAAVISGLPFASNGNGYGALAVGYATSTMALFINVDNGATTFRFYGVGGAAITNAMLSGKEIRFAGTYQANA